MPPPVPIAQLMMLLGLLGTYGIALLVVCYMWYKSQLMTSHHTGVGFSNKQTKANEFRLGRLLQSCFVDVSGRYMFIALSKYT